MPTPALTKSSLKDGQFDEGESHNTFLEALNAWRSAGSNEPSSNKKVRFNDQTVQGERPQMPKQKVDKETLQARRGPKPPAQTKLSCYNCYKLFYVNDGEVSLRSKSDKEFCSERC